jgi:hypothetical protein
MFNNPFKSNKIKDNNKPSLIKRFSEATKKLLKYTPVVVAGILSWNSNASVSTTTVNQINFDKFSNSSIAVNQADNSNETDLTKIVIKKDNNEVKYTVQKWDTASEIAEKFNVSLIELDKHNDNLDLNNFIHPGQVFEIPTSIKNEVNNKNIASNNIDTIDLVESVDNTNISNNNIDWNKNSHNVVTGDNLWNISEKYEWIKYLDLLKWNKHLSHKKYAVHPWDTVYLESQNDVIALNRKINKIDENTVKTEKALVFSSKIKKDLHKLLSEDPKLIIYLVKYVENYHSNEFEIKNTNDYTKSDKKNAISIFISSTNIHRQRKLIELLENKSIFLQNKRLIVESEENREFYAGLINNWVIRWREGDACGNWSRYILEKWTTIDLPNAGMDGYKYPQKLEKYNKDNFVKIKISHPNDAPYLAFVPYDKWYGWTDDRKSFGHVDIALWNGKFIYNDKVRNHSWWSINTNDNRLDLKKTGFLWIAYVPVNFKVKSKYKINEIAQVKKNEEKINTTVWINEYLNVSELIKSTQLGIWKDVSDTIIFSWKPTSLENTDNNVIGINSNKLANPIIEKVLLNVKNIDKRNELRWKLWDNPLDIIYKTMKIQKEDYDNVTNTNDIDKIRQKRYILELHKIATELLTYNTKMNNWKNQITRKVA